MQIGRAPAANLKSRPDNRCANRSIGRSVDHQLGISISRLSPSRLLQQQLHLIPGQFQPAENFRQPETKGLAAREIRLR